MDTARFYALAAIALVAATVAVNVLVLSGERPHPLRIDPQEVDAGSAPVGEEQRLVVSVLNNSNGDAVLYGANGRCTPDYCVGIDAGRKDVKAFGKTQVVLLLTPRRSGPFSAPVEIYCGDSEGNSLPSLKVAIVGLAVDDGPAGEQ